MYKVMFTVPFLIGFGFIQVVAFAEENINLPVIRINSETSKNKTYQSSALTGFNHSLLDLPFNQSHVSKTQIQNQNIVRIQDALTSTSGVFYQDSYGGGFWDNYSFRGFSTDPNMGTNSLRNGLSAVSGIHTPRDMVNIESIDFLKGPMAAMYGQGAIGGVMNITTKKPSWETAHEISISASSYEQYRTSLDTTGALTDQIAYRLGLAYENNQSFRNKVDHENYFIALQFSFKLSPATQLDVDTEFSAYQGVFDRGIPLINGQFANIKNFYNDPRDGNMQVKDRFFQLRLEHEFNPNWKSTTALSYDRGVRGGTSTEVSSFSNPTNQLNRFRRYRHFATENTLFQSMMKGKFDIGHISHELLGNIELSDYQIHQFQQRNAVGTNSPISFDTPSYDQPILQLARTTKQTKEHQKNIALNLQDQIFLNAAWNLLFGVRIDQMQQSITDFKTGISAQKDYKPISPRVGINYKFNDQLAFYANWGKAFEMNTGLNKDNQLYAPERTKSIEFGGKYQFLPMSWLSLIYFDMKKEHLLTEGISDNYVDSGQVRSYGIEFTLAHQFTDAWSILLNYTLTNASIIESEIEAKGARLKNIPKHNANLTTQYQFNAFGHPANLHLNVNHYGQRSANYIDNGSTLPAFTVINVGGQIALTPQLKAQLNISNLFDKTYYVSSYTNYWVQPGEPLKATLTLNYQF